MGMSRPESLLFSGLLAEKLEIAKRAVLQEACRDDELCSEVTERSLSSLKKYLARFDDWSQVIGAQMVPKEWNDEFRAWVYCLCEQHVWWAAQSVWKKNAKRDKSIHNNLDLEAFVEHAPLPEIVYARVFRLVSSAADQLPPRRRNVVWDHLAKRSIQESANRNGVTENTVKSYRKEFFRTAKQIIADELAAFGY